MLKNLKIKNVALIREADIEFNTGLNVLSGETGSGKSVVLDSLNFALGQKADKTMICHGQTDCSVSCSFDVANVAGIKEIFEDLGIEYDDEVIVKRTLNIDGRSTIKLNGESVTATMLKKVTSLLVDLHGQSDHFLLLKEANQLALIDGLCGAKINCIGKDIAVILQEIRDIDNKLATLGGDEQARLRKLDLLKFSIDEITNANLRDGEDEELLTRKRKLQNAEKITLNCGESLEALTSENGASDLLSGVYRKISALGSFDDEYEALSQRIDKIIDEISDISQIIEDSFDTEFSPRELDEIEARLDQISALKRKYGKTYQEIMLSLESFKSEYELISDSWAQTEKLNKKRAERLDSLEALYKKLTKERKMTAEKLCDSLSLKLKELAMPSAQFAVDFSLTDGEVLSTKGRDGVCFMFSANRGEPLKPLSKVISGGELSRLMLAIKAVTGGAFGAQTFIFDEIDVGISGEAAKVVAKNFAKISKQRQIVAISHLPQIVAMADVGFLIEKKENQTSTITYVNRLDEKGKLGEVLRLVGGNDQSQAAINHASEMILEANDFKSQL